MIQNAMTKPLVDFTYLQVLDILTTIAFLAQGVTEANPVVAASIRVAGPLGGLILIKGVAIVLGIVCYVQARRKLLNRINAFFALVVAMNLVSLILSSPLINPGFVRASL